MYNNIKITTIMKRIAIIAAVCVSMLCTQAQTVVKARYMATNGIDYVPLAYIDTLEFFVHVHIDYGEYIYLSGFTYGGAYTMYPQVMIVNNTNDVLPRGTMLGINASFNDTMMDYWEEYIQLEYDMAAGDTLAYVLGGYSEPLIRQSSILYRVNSICFMITSMNYNTPVYDAGACAGIAWNDATVVNEAHEQEALMVYPNPARNVITISHADNAMVEIYAVNGQKMAACGQVNGSVQVPVSTWPAGMYIVRAVTPHKVYTQKVMVKQ